MLIKMSTEEFNRARTIVIEQQQCSVQFVQRKLKVGYLAAALIVAGLEANGVVGPENGSKYREVLIH